MADYILARACYEDIASLEEYIARENPIAATKVVNALFDLCDSIGENPTLGHRHPCLMDTKYRVRTIYSYTIIYNPHTLPVRILRIIHAARNFKHINL